MKVPPVADRLRLERRWIRLREVGWVLLAVWPILTLTSEFMPLDLESRALRIAGKIVGIVGLALVAVGFEFLMRIKHPHAYEGPAEASGRTP